MDPNFFHSPSPLEPIKTFTRSTKLTQPPKTSTDTYSAAIDFTVPDEPGVSYRISRSLDGVTFYNYDVYLVSGGIAVRKKGNNAAPEDGLIVKKNDVLEIAISPLWFNEPKKAEDRITWKFRQLKGDGSLTAWLPFEDSPKGTKFEDATLTKVGGIYEVKAILKTGVELLDYPYIRSKDAAFGEDSAGTPNPIYKKGQPDYVGVVSNQWQIAVLDAAKALAGPSGYAQAQNMPVYPGGPSTVGISKCNIFVYHACINGGTTVPLIARDDGNWPPTARIWWENVVLGGWDNLMQATFPQPGYVVSRPEQNIQILGKDFTLGGHTGILDYDGGWWNAGPETVNKFPNLAPPKNEYQPARFRKTSTP